MRMGSEDHAVGPTVPRLGTPGRFANAKREQIDCASVIHQTGLILRALCHLFRVRAAESRPLHCNGF